MIPLAGIWKTFLDLLPTDPRLTATVLHLNAGGSYTVTLAGGGTAVVTAEGTYATGDKVFIRGGKIEGKAPALTQVVIEV